MDHQRTESLVVRRVSGDCVPALEVAAQFLREVLAVEEGWRPTAGSHAGRVARTGEEEGAQVILEDMVDQYGEVRQRPGLAAAVADALVRYGQVLMSWCDGHGTRLTLMLAVPVKIGYVPGYSGPILYVGVEGFGCYGFAVNRGELHPDYIAEKFGRRETNPTWTELAALLSDVRAALAGAQ